MKFIKNVLMVMSIGCVSAIGLQLQKAEASTSTVTHDNIEALIEPALDTSYFRNANNCVFNIGVGGKASFIGIGIFRADADGMISVPEQVSCMAGGFETCRPVECIDILALLAGVEIEVNPEME